jgi:acetolactate synthase I/II/III large subunit
VTGGDVTVAQVTVDALRAAGVETVYAYPGDPIIEFMEAAHQSGIDIVLARREGTAGFMAEGHAMTSGNVGCCLSTLGPGSTALVNPVAAANLDRVPMIAISGQIETARQATFTHQVVAHEQLYAPITKWAGRVEANAAAITMRKALRLAVAERPGAVHLSCAADTFKATATDAEILPVPVETANGAVRVVRAPDRTADPVTLLGQARRPLLLAGIGAVRNGAGAAVRELAATVQMPVVVAPMAKGVVPEDFEWFGGVLDMACNDIVWQLARDSDLIIAAGFDAVELIKPWRVAAPVLHVDTLANTDQVYPAAVELIGDIATSLSWLSGEFRGEGRWTSAELTEYRRRLSAAYYAGRVEGALNPTDVIDVVRAAMPRETIATSDVGSHKLLVGQGWQTWEPRSTLMTNGLSAMGFGVPAAIGAKLARPDRPVVALVGDGGFAMTALEMRLAAARGLGITVVVFVDGSLNRIELKQMANNYASTATRIEDTDLVKLAEAMGCDGARAESVSALEKCLADAADRSRPLIVEARIDPAQYKSQF